MDIWDFCLDLAMGIWAFVANLAGFDFGQVFRCRATICVWTVN